MTVTRVVVERLRASSLSAPCLAVSAIALGHALQIRDGFYSPEALNWLTIAFAFCITGVLAHRWTDVLVRRSVPVVATILALGIAWQIYQLFVARSPGMYLRGGANMTLFKAGVTLQALLAVASCVPSRWIRRLGFPTLLAVSLGMGVWLIHASPDPRIDVVTVHKEAIRALLEHRDPYRITFENIYDATESRTFYNPAAVFGDRLAQAYPYPPVSLLLAVPGYVLFGDYRYSELALLVAAAGLIGFSRPAITAKLAASLLLTTPRIWFVIEQGWTEPIAVFMLALTVFLLVRNPIAAGWAGGVLAVTKQYLGFAGLAVLRMTLIRPKQWFWIAAGIALGAAAVTLPLALWHPNAFMRNVVWLQTLEPFRMDSLSFLSWAAHRGMGQGSYRWAVGAAIVAAIVSLATTRNTAGGFAASVTLTTFAMFAFGSKAFCNYYFFVIGSLCCALAAYSTDAAVPSEPEATG